MSLQIYSVCNINILRQTVFLPLTSHLYQWIHLHQIHNAPPTSVQLVIELILLYCKYCDLASIKISRRDNYFIIAVCFATK